MAQKFTTPIVIRNITSAASDALAVSVDGEAADRIKFEAGGRLVWGGGASAGDVNLYRHAADLLKTDDTFEAASGIITLTTSGAPTTSLSDGALAIDTANDIFYFRSGGSWREVSSVSVTALSLLTDVNIPSPSDGDVLQYDNNSGEWVSASAPSGLPTGGSAGQVLSKVDGTNYNTQWVDTISGDGGTPSTPIRVLVAMDAGGV